MWPDLIQKAKEGGLDVIQTYVFWNGHEPEQGKVIISFTLLHFILIQTFFLCDYFPNVYFFIYDFISIFLVGFT